MLKYILLSYTSENTLFRTATQTKIINPLRAVFRTTNVSRRCPGGSSQISASVRSWTVWGCSGVGCTSTCFIGAQLDSDQKKRGASQWLHHPVTTQTFCPPTLGVLHQEEPGAHCTSIRPDRHSEFWYFTEISAVTKFLKVWSEMYRFHFPRLSPGSSFSSLHISTM